MPRIRTIKPDAFLSESLSSVPRGTRWTFAGLWTYADDAGRGRDDARLIHAALYPLDDDVTLDDVHHDLDQLHRIGGICRYEVDGRRYLHMPKWHHQKINRPTPAKSPPCPLHESGGSGHVLDPEPSVSPHGRVTEPSRGEKEVEREVEVEGEGSFLSDKSDDALARFDEFWNVYDNKVGRAKCETAYRNALRKPGVTDDLLIAAAGAYVDWCRATSTYLKNPLTWLHGEHWRDERKPPRPAEPESRVQGWLRLANEAAEEDQTNVRAIGGSR